MNPLMDRKGYEKTRREVLEWLPNRLIDCHVHTPLILYETPRRAFNKSLLKLYFEDRKSVTKENFNSLYPEKNVNIFGFPPPYSEAVPEKVNRDILKQNIWTLLLDDKKENLEKCLSEKVIGLKSHWKLINKKAGFHDLINEEKCRFMEKNNLALLIELSNPPENFSVLKEIESTYNFKIILPHMAFNHEGFVMSKESFEKSFHSHRKEYDALSKIANTENIYLDISMKPNFDLLKTAIKFLGSDRILFGSDYPFGLTPKIHRERDEIGEDKLFADIREIILGKEKEFHWVYYKNIYILLQVIKNVCEKEGVDGKSIMYKNAKKFLK